MGSGADYSSPELFPGSGTCWVLGSGQSLLGMSGRKVLEEAPDLDASSSSVNISLCPFLCHTSSLVVPGPVS